MLMKYRSGFRHFEHVPCPAHGMQEFRLTVRVDLLSQIVHIHVDHIGEGIKVHSPYVLSNERAAEHSSWVTEEKFQQCNLLGCQLDAFVRPRHLAGHQVEAEISQSEHWSRHRRPTA